MENRKNSIAIPAEIWMAMRNYPWLLVNIGQREMSQSVDSKLKAGRMRIIWRGHLNCAPSWPIKRWFLMDRHHLLVLTESWDMSPGKRNQMSWNHRNAILHMRSDSDEDMKLDHMRCMSQKCLSLGRSHTEWWGVFLRYLNPSVNIGRSFLQPLFRTASENPFPSISPSLGDLWSSK
jgi:hypothetical protein